MLKQEIIKRTALLVASAIAIGGGFYWYHESALKQVAQTPVFEEVGKTRSPLHLYFPSPIILDKGQFLLVGSEGTIQIYDPIERDLKVVTKIEGQDIRVASVNELDSQHFLITGWERRGKAPFSKVYNINNNSLNNTGSLNVPRVDYSVVQLDDGKVLMAGGISQGKASGALEIFDPETRQYRLLSVSLKEGFSKDSAIKLSNGHVLFLGSTIQLFDPSQETVNILTKWDGGKKGFSVQRLSDDRVLLVSIGYPAKALIYSPDKNNFQQIWDKPLYRISKPTMALLPDGRVLIAGGQSCGTAQACPYGPGVVELFNPHDNSFSLVGRTKGEYLRISPLLEWNHKIYLFGSGVVPGSYVEVFNQGV